MKEASVSDGADMCTVQEEMVDLLAGALIGG